MKKVIIIIAHFLLLFTLILTIGLKPRVGGSGFEKFTGELEHGATIYVLENDTAIKQGYLNELLTAFNEEYKDYNITARDANMDQYSDLEKDGPYGHGPDVLYQANDRLMRYVEGKHIQPLPVDDLDTTAQVSDNAWHPFRANVGGKSYTFGVPVNIQGPLMFYRKDLIPVDFAVKYDVNNNGIPDMLESFNALYEFSQELHTSDPKKFGYMKALADPYFSAGYLFSYGGYVFGNNDQDTKDIGFSNGDAVKGAKMIKDLASIMDERSIDYTITPIAYSELAKGNFFATITTPDVHTMFLSEFSSHGVPSENLGVTVVPKLPKSGNLSDKIMDFENELIDANMMGGVHGYSMSSYTKYPNASLAFIDYATKYEMIKRRQELLGIAPARVDVAEEVEGLSLLINQNLAEGNIYIMPSNRAVGQIWTPLETLFQDIAKDPFRPGQGQPYKYVTDDDFLNGLKRVDTQIYDAIHTLG